MTIDTILDKIAAYLPGIIAALPVAAAVILGGVLANMVVRRSLSLLAKRTSLTPSDVLPLKNIARWVITVLTLILVLGVFGFQLGGLWAMLSTVLAMIAIGFVAVWSILSNTSATVLILIMRPFHIGDEIELPSEGVKGRVTDLNFFFTTVAVDHETAFRVPNNLFFQKVIKRTPGASAITLAQQLSNPEPAKFVPISRPKDEKSDKKPLPASEDFAAKAVGDPASMGIPTGDSPSPDRSR